MQPEVLNMNLRIITALIGCLNGARSFKHELFF